MAKRVALVMAGVFLMATAVFGEEEKACNRLGIGAHYWVTVDDINTNDIDEDGIGWRLVYQRILNSIFRVEGSLDLIPDTYAGSDEWVLSPQVMAIVGFGLYGGVGVGIHYSDGDFADDPYFTFRVGFDMPIMPGVFLDLNANYHFDTWDFGEFEEDIDTDTVTFGLTLKMAF